jgi:hypothetical protein
LSESESEEIIRGIFKGSKKIPEKVFEKTFKKISEGVSTGYGAGADGVDADMIHQLKNNVKVFAAFKANAYKDTMISLLVDQDNKQRLWPAYLKEAKKVDASYNTQWLAAEYKMAIRQARGAKQWATFERDKGVYPNLQFMPSRSANPRDSHTRYYGIIRAINDPFWVSAYPPLDWGCNCWVQQTKEPETEWENDFIETPPGIAANSGIQKKVFTADHSYLDAMAAADKMAVKRFLRENKDLAYEQIQIKIGKNKIVIPIDADPSDMIRNINTLVPVVKKYKTNFSINSHSAAKGVKNPEFTDNKGVVGDGVYMDSKEPAKTIKDAFKKLQPTKQLGKNKEVFLAINFNGKLTKDNLESAARKIYGEMKANSKCRYMILVNESKSLIVKQGETKQQIETKAKKELLK